MNIDTSKVIITEFDGIDHKDFPDFCDAYISTAEYFDEEFQTDRDLLEEEIEYLMENERDWFYEQLNNYLF